MMTYLPEASLPEMLKIEATGPNISNANRFINILRVEVLLIKRIGILSKYCHEQKFL